MGLTTEGGGVGIGIVFRTVQLTTDKGEFTFCSFPPTPLPKSQVGITLLFQTHLYYDIITRSSLSPTFTSHPPVPPAWATQHVEGGEGV